MTVPWDVLVIEDDADLAEMIEVVLESEGYEVRTAVNGKEALKVLGEWRPDVILLDLKMPVMDGWTFLARQQTDPELVQIPVIVMSAYYNLRGGSKRVPAAEVLAKPFQIKDLLSKVEALIH